MKTHWKKSFDSPYLGSWDLEDYKDITLTIKKAVGEMTKDLKENSVKNIVYFEENFKPMICNSGNSKVISALSKSPYMEEWNGTRITLTVKQVRAFGETHDALRVKTKTDELPILNAKHPKFKAVLGAIKNKTYTLEQIKVKYQVSAEVEKQLLS